MNSSFRATPTNKIEKALLIARHWRILSPIPQGGKVTIAACSCPVTYCDCPVELEFGGDADAWSADSEQSETFAWRVLEFLETVDPTNYRELAEDATAIPWVSQEQRIWAMSERVAAGLSAKSAADCNTIDLKVGGMMDRNRNGSVSFYGVEEFDDDDDGY